jgi:hypothetical protein
MELAPGPVKRHQSHRAFAVSSGLLSQRTKLGGRRPLSWEHGVSRHPSLNRAVPSRQARRAPEPCRRVREDLLEG